MALAMLSAVREYGLTIVSATSLMDAPFKCGLEQLGASVILVEDAIRTGNQEGRLSELQRVLYNNPSAFWPKQYDNPDNPAAYSRLAEAMVEKVGRVDCVVACVGSGGSLTGVIRYLRSLFPEVRAVAVDTNNSVLFGHRAGPRLLRGLGNSILPKNLDHTIIDDVHWVGQCKRSPQRESFTVVVRCSSAPPAAPLRLSVTGTLGCIRTKLSSRSCLIQAIVINRQSIPTTG
ncbi:pyridoxal-phosphate dependent enzyme [Ensifer adhaerens]|uniref:pyridoxal-phosphate dependent enzyme n=1 Tax=Ensifer adhaerens TaxID=106592 RepID=UPI00384D9F91